MTTTTTPVAPPSRPTPSPLHGLVRTTLRVHRWALWVWLGLLAVVSGILLWTYGPAANEVRSVLDSAPRPAEGGVPGGVERPFWEAYDLFNMGLDFGEIAIMVLPVLLGAWAAASLTGRELETDTAHLAWTQSVTPVRWLAVKLALPALCTVLGSTLLVLLYRLASSEDANLGKLLGTGPRWYHEEIMVAAHPVGVLRALCGLAVGALLGLLLRRALPALGVALAVLSGIFIGLTVYRKLLWPPETFYGMSHDMGDILHVDHGGVTTSGDHVAYDWDCVSHHLDDAAARADCLAGEGLRDVWTTYHPSSHFWPLQLAESAVLLVLTVLAVAASFWIVRRRTG